MTLNVSSGTGTAGSLVAYAMFDSIPADTLLTRKQLADALKERGIPVSPKTLSTKACRGGGPPYQRFGKVALYKWGLAVEWAFAQMSAPASSATEHKAARAA
jgi:hypothetical protein